MTTNDPPGICQLTGERCPPECSATFQPCAAARGTSTEALLAAHETGRLAGHQECRVAVAMLRVRCEQQATTIEMLEANARKSALQAQQQHEEIERLRAELAAVRVGA